MTTRTGPKLKRIMELEQQLAELEIKKKDCLDWLLKNFGHEDRNKIFNDKAFYELEIARIKKKLENLNNARPELGTMEDYERAMLHAPNVSTNKKQ